MRGRRRRSEGEKKGRKERMKEGEKTFRAAIDVGLSINFGKVGAKESNEDMYKTKGEVTEVKSKNKGHKEGRLRIKEKGRTRLGLVFCKGRNKGEKRENIKRKAK